MLDKLRMRLASERSGLLELSAMGVIVGILAAAIIIAFRLLVEDIQLGFLPDNDPENYESLPKWLIFTLPTVGGIVLGLLFQLLKPSQRSVGVVHTIERLDYHQGRLPLINFLAQFIGAAISIISGHSVGREGPSIHLGAAGGSFFGQWLKLPNNAIRTLVACGSAAAIAASFNTPIAGVILTIEIILFELSAATMLPVILASVAATSCSHLVFGNDALLNASSLGSTTLNELPWIVITGVVIGLLGATFIRLLLFFTELSQRWPIWLRMSLGGLSVGVFALITPSIMSIGYDSVVGAMGSNMVLAALVVIAIVKLFATATGLGLGLPGGLIGPSVVIGATAGGAVGAFGLLVSPDTVTTPGIYALLGIGAMLGSAIQAPLAALMTMFELTQNPHIIMPGMLAVAIAHLVTVSVFREGPIFYSLLKARGLDYKNDPIAQAQRRVGITHAMSHDFITINQKVAVNLINRQLDEDTRWILVTQETGNHYLMPVSDLQAFIKREPEIEVIDLDLIPATRLTAVGISPQSTLQDAWEQMEDTDFEAVYVKSHIKNDDAVNGILTYEDILAHQSTSPKRRMKRD